MIPNAGSGTCGARASGETPLCAPVISEKSPLHTEYCTGTPPEDGGTCSSKSGFAKWIAQLYSAAVWGMANRPYYGCTEQTDEQSRSCSSVGTP